MLIVSTRIEFQKQELVGQCCIHIQREKVFCYTDVTVPFKILIIPFSLSIQIFFPMETKTDDALTWH